MTTFDSIALLLAILIIIMLLFFGVVWKLLDDIKGWQKSIWQELRGIRVNVADTAEYTHNHIAPDVESISNNIPRLLDESPTKIDWDELSKQQQDEFLKRLIMPNYDSPFKPPFNPTCETTNKED